MSAATNSALPPAASITVTVGSRLSGSQAGAGRTSPAMTRAPSRANRIAMARPMPDPAPVTSASGRQLTAVPRPGCRPRPGRPPGGQDGRNKGVASRMSSAAPAGPTLVADEIHAWPPPTAARSASPNTVVTHATTCSCSPTPASEPAPSVAPPPPPRRATARAPSAPPLRAGLGQRAQVGLVAARERVPDHQADRGLDQRRRRVRPAVVPDLLDVADPLADLKCGHRGCSFPGQAPARNAPIRAAISAGTSRCR